MLWGKAFKYIRTVFYYLFNIPKKKNMLLNDYLAINNRKMGKDCEEAIHRTNALGLQM